MTDLNMSSPGLMSLVARTLLPLPAPSSVTTW